MFPIGLVALENDDSDMRLSTSFNRPSLGAGLDASRGSLCRDYMQTDASESRHSSIIHTSVQLNTVAQTLPASCSTQPQHHTHLLSWSTSPPRMRCSSPSWGRLPQSVSVLACSESDAAQISAYGSMHVTPMRPFSYLPPNASAPSRRQNTQLATCLHTPDVLE